MLLLLFFLLASNEMYSEEQHCVWLQICVTCKDLYIVKNTCLAMGECQVIN